MDKFALIDQLNAAKTTCERNRLEMVAYTIDEAKKFIQKGNEDDTEILRDHFAGLALNKMVLTLDGNIIQDIEAYAATAYKIADAMLKHRSQRSPISATTDKVETDFSLAAKTDPA